MDSSEETELYTPPGQLRQSSINHHNADVSRLQKSSSKGGSDDALSLILNRLDTLTNTQRALLEALHRRHGTPFSSENYLSSSSPGVEFPSSGDEDSPMDARKNRNVYSNMLPVPLPFKSVDDILKCEKLLTEQFIEDEDPEKILEEKKRAETVFGL